ncbi:TonB-dependent receptor [Prolixibacteraceae bacterium Z1-6]|uniref:TonB-dependent receptor n=1 Tax=Draconibacterium aestuarii TaxID=2998507 RepID=A0A9X3FD62_9BACT|nr:TonB-dependent receptor [Prolixibacteraceae bacterium Z1-6]
MKKNLLRDSLDPGFVKKTMRIMRLTAILIFGIIFTVSAKSYSQSTRLDLQFKGCTIIDVFEYVEENSEFIFLYKNQDLDVNKTFNLDLKNVTIDQILDEVLNSQNVTYDVYDRQVVIRKSKETDSVKQLQEKTITGAVTDNSGLPLPGVTVVVAGTTVGTVTDFDGKFTLVIPDNAENLQVSFVGMKTQVIAINGQTNFVVSLEEDSIGLEEVVAVGYGTQTKRNVTGSIQTVSSEDLKDLPVAQITQALQGKVSGVQINQTTGVPGEALNIRVRGQGSISAGSDPLYVVDGFPISGKLTDLNPEEIESITILKDAASTSLYGSRAANGVILVQTKQAKTGQTKIDFTAYYGVQTLSERGRPDMMNGTEFAQFKKESYEDAGLDVPEAFQNPSQYGEGTDWYDIMFRAAPVQNYTLSLSSGTEKLKASVVAGYFNQDGILINSGYDRASVRLNTEFKVNEMLKFGFNVAPSLSSNKTPSKDAIFWQGGLLYNSLLAWPILDYQNEDGSLPLTAWAPGLGGFPTPNYYRAAKEIQNETDRAKVLSNAFVQIEPVSGLVIKSSLNFQYESNKNKYFNPSTASSGFATAPPITSFADYANNWIQSWLMENTVTYTKSINDHNFDVLTGYTTQKFSSNLMSVSVKNFADDRISDIDAATIINEDGTDGDVQEWSLISYLSRFNYNYKNKYMLSLAIRRDGSSRFGENNRWGNFPSLSGGWILSEEDFFPGNGLFSLVKIRGSWGVTGNNNIGNYTHYALVDLGENAVFNGSVESGSAVTNLSNAELGWERTKQIDLGIDVAILNNRIDLAYDFYSKKTTDLLYDFSIAPSSGFSTFTGNSGELKFWGHEISVQSRNTVGEFKWTTNFNISFTDNEVISLADNVEALYSPSPFPGNHITKIGERIGLFWGLVHDGVYDNQEEYNNSAKASASAVGTVKFKDVNDDGEILNTNTGGDRTVIGDPTPDFLFGMTNTFSYKNFDLAVTMSGSYGNDIANQFETGATNLDGPFNVLKEVANRWRSEENPGDGLYGTTKYNTYMERDWFNSRFIEDGSYLTIKNVTLGYTFDVKNITFLKNLRVYASAQQLYTFTKYSGNNPEVSTSLDGSAVSVLNLGDDYAAYPVPTTWTFGVNVGF